MTHRSALLGITAAACTFLLQACTTPTTLSTVWKSSFTGPPKRNILVVGIARTDVARRSYEDSLARALRSRGVTAVPSYTFFPDESQISEAALRAKVRQGGFDAVLATRLLNIDREKRYIPPTTQVVPGGYYGYGLYGYYPYAWDVVRTPGYVSESTVVRLETNLYDAPGGKLLWIAQSDTIDPTSTQDAINSVVGKITGRMAQDRLIP